MVTADHTQVSALLTVLREMHAHSHGLNGAESSRRFFLGRMCWLFKGHAAMWSQAELTANGVVRPLATLVEGVQARGLENALRLPEVSPLFETAARFPGLVRSSVPREDLMFARLSGRGPVLHVIGFMRVGATGFDAQAVALLQLLADNPWLFGRLVSDESSVAVAQLSPRLRQTLELLLEGATEKRIAATLSLSSHTVHDYVKELYRRFDVCSRSELLASLLGRPQAQSFPAQ